MMPRPGVTRIRNELDQKIVHWRLVVVQVEAPCGGVSECMVNIFIDGNPYIWYHMIVVERLL